MTTDWVDWGLRHEALLEAYCERLFESETLEQWLGATQWYWNAAIAQNRSC